MMKWLIKYQKDKYKKTLLDHGGGGKKGKEPKYGDRIVEIKRTRQSNQNENKRKNYYGEKKQQDIKSKSCMKRDKYFDPGVQCGRSRMVLFPM